MLIMLASLKEESVLQSIADNDPKSYTFITDILQQKEEFPDEPLSGKQFKWVCSLYDEYC